MKIGVVTDSNSGILPEEAEKLGVWLLPMPFYIDGNCYYENIDLTRQDFFAKLAAGAEIATSSPAPLALAKLWHQALQECDQILHIPMSSGLSSSCELAMSLAREEAFVGKVFVADIGRVATPMHRSVLDALELLAQGFSAAEVQRLLERQRADMTIYVMVDELKHLAKGGRISHTTAALGSILNVKPVLQFDVGMLNMQAKCRGKKRARHLMIEAMQADLQGKFKQQWENKEVHLVAAGSADTAETEDWLAQINEAFPGVPVMYDDLPLSLCAHIGENGLGIGCSCRVKPE